MELTIDDLTVNFDHLPQTTLLEDWEWLIGTTKQPILVTAVGDAFLKDMVDGSVHWLAVGNADFRPIASDVLEFRSLLTDQEFVLDYFAVEALLALKGSGIVLGPGQVYSLKLPAVLGGKYSFDNIAATEIAAHFSLTGQIHRQVKDLPPGTKITGVEIE